MNALGILKQQIQKYKDSFVTTDLAGVEALADMLVIGAQERTKSKISSVLYVQSYETP